MTTQNAIKFFRFFAFDLQKKSDLSDYSFSDLKNIIEDLRDNYLEKIDINIVNAEEHPDLDERVSLEILKTCLKACDSDFNDLEYWEFINLIAEINENLVNDEFYLDSLPHGECRLINESIIDEIWTESIIEQIKECYDLSNIPDFVSIDWEQTAENCKDDGLGHHFASYDGEEHYSRNFHIFRTN